MYEKRTSLGTGLFITSQCSLSRKSFAAAGGSYSRDNSAHNEV